MKYIKTYEDLNDTDYLLCILSDNDYFTTGKTYKVYNSIETKIGELVNIQLKNNDNEMVNIECYIPDKEEFRDAFYGIFSTIAFTKDLSIDEYKFRKLTNKYNL